MMLYENFILNLFFIKKILNNPKLNLKKKFKFNLFFNNSYLLKNKLNLNFFYWNITHIFFNKKNLNLILKSTNKKKLKNIKIINNFFWFKLVFGWNIAAYQYLKLQHFLYWYKEIYWYISNINLNLELNKIELNNIPLLEFSKKTIKIRESKKFNLIMPLYLILKDLKNINYLNKIKISKNDWYKKLKINNLYCKNNIKFNKKFKTLFLCVNYYKLFLITCFGVNSSQFLYLEEHKDKIKKFCEKQTYKLKLNILYVEHLINNNLEKWYEGKYIAYKKLKKLKILLKLLFKIDPPIKDKKENIYVWTYLSNKKKFNNLKKKVKIWKKEEKKCFWPNFEAFEKTFFKWDYSKNERILLRCNKRTKLDFKWQQLEAVVFRAFNFYLKKSSKNTTKKFDAFLEKQIYIDYKKKINFSVSFYKNLLQKFLYLLYYNYNFSSKRETKKMMSNIYFIKKMGKKVLFNFFRELELSLRFSKSNIYLNISSYFLPSYHCSGGFAFKYGSEQNKKKTNYRKSKFKKNIGALKKKRKDFKKKSYFAIRKIVNTLLKYLDKYKQKFFLITFYTIPRNYVSRLIVKMWRSRKKQRMFLTERIFKPLLSHNGMRNKKIRRI